MSLENGFFADIEKLHAHQSEAAQDARDAAGLLEEMKRAYQLCEAMGDRRMENVLKDTERIARYCDKKHHYIDELCSEVEQLSLNIGTIIEDSNDSAQRLFRYIEIISDL